jgi:hypothetical protein
MTVPMVNEQFLCSRCSPARIRRRRGGQSLSQSLQFSAKVIRRKRARATSFSGNAEDQGEGEELLSAKEVIENLFSDNKDDNKKKKNTFDDDVYARLFGTDTDTDNSNTTNNEDGEHKSVSMNLLEFATVCKKYYRRGGNVDELVDAFARSRYNTKEFVEQAFETCYEAKMSKEATVEVLIALQEITTICARYLRERVSVPEHFLADECVRAISQSRYKQVMFRDDSEIDRARERVRKMMLEAFVDQELFPTATTKQKARSRSEEKLLNFPKFARQVSVIRSTAEEDKANKLSIATSLIGISELIIEQASEKVFNKADYDLEISQNAYERVINSCDEVIALCLELEIEKKTMPDMIKIAKAETFLTETKKFVVGTNE